MEMTIMKKADNLSTAKENEKRGERAESDVSIVKENACFPMSAAIAKIIPQAEPTIAKKPLHPLLNESFFFHRSEPAAPMQNNEMRIAKPVPDAMPSIMLMNVVAVYACCSVFQEYLGYARELFLVLGDRRGFDSVQE